MKKNMVLSMIVALILLICCSAVQGASSNLLRLEGPCGWTQHIGVPQGATAYLVVLAAKEGNGFLIDRYSDGSLNNCSYYFLAYDRLPFNANTPGRHILSYIVNGKESNTVAIDVVGTNVQIYCQTPLAAPQEVALAPTPAPALTPSVSAVSLSRGIPNAPLGLHYDHVGSHIMNDQNGIVIPQYAPQYYFGRDFSLGTINGNYPGTPFLTQFLADP
jgi:hypothetical protein